MSCSRAFVGRSDFARSFCKRLSLVSSAIAFSKMNRTGRTATASPGTQRCGPVRERLALVPLFLVRALTVRPLLTQRVDLAHEEDAAALGAQFLGHMIQAQDAFAVLAFAGPDGSDLACGSENLSAVLIPPVDAGERNLMAGLLLLFAHTPLL